MFRGLRLALAALASLLILPSAAYAQASLTGVVRDTSGPCSPASRSRRQVPP